MKIYNTTPEGYILTRAGFEKKNSLKPAREIPSDSCDEVEKCREWIRLFTKTQKSINNKAYSYSLKHRVEDWANKYVSNGDFIKAALLEGYNFSQNFSKNTPFKDDGLNVFFNMELPEDKWRNIKPTNFSKWLFRRIDENSPIGDLARDAYNDPTWSRTSKRFYDFWIYLNSLNVSHFVMESLRSAWEEYSGKESPFPDDNIIFKCESFYSNECDVVRYNETYSNAPDNSTYIYVLFEEETMRRVKYVGKTITPGQRLKQHVLTPGNLEKLAWIGKLVNEGRFPCMGIIDTVPLINASRIEQTYVYAFADFERNDGQDIKDVLLNKSLT